MGGSAAHSGVTTGSDSDESDTGLPTTGTALISGTATGVGATPVASTATGVGATPVGATPAAGTATGVGATPAAGTATGVGATPVAGTATGVGATPVAGTATGVGATPVAGTATGGGAAATGAVTTGAESGGAAVGSSPTVTESEGVTTEGSSTTAEDSVLATMSRLLQAQRDALTAQTRAAAAHHLPPLKPFTGEGQQSRDDSFDQWLERFEERACLVGWSKSQQLHQLKLLLEETALRAFRMFPEADREDYDKAKSALKSRFRAVDIEELRGLEFHHKVQSDETVEELGMELQRLGNKAFPSIRGRELDRLLKGRFFQALHVRWQRKLGAPKTDETFKELYDRARMLEQREKQYAVSAATRDASGDGPKRSEKFTRQRSGHSGGGQKRPPKPSSGSAGQSQGTSSASPPRTLPTRVCYTRDISHENAHSEPSTQKPLDGLKEQLLHPALLHWNPRVPVLSLLHRASCPPHSYRSCWPNGWWTRSRP